MIATQHPPDSQPSTHHAPHNLPPYPIPDASASLLLSHRPQGRRVLIVGSSRLAASRALATLEAGAQPVIVAHNGIHAACDELKYRIHHGQVLWRDEPALQAPSNHQQRTPDPEESLRSAWSTLLDELDQSGGEAKSLFAVAVTDTLHLGDTDAPPPATTSADNNDDATYSPSPPPSPLRRAALLAQLCRARRIPINVADQPHLCDFSFPATHRFPCSRSPFADAAAAGAPPPSTQLASSLQIAVTTNGRGCRLAGRIRREIVAALPRNVGDAVERVGEMREMAKRGGAGGGRRTSVAGGGAAGKPSSSDAGAPVGGRGHAADHAAMREEGGVRDKATTPPPKTPTTARRMARRGDATPRTAAELEEDDLSFDTTPINTPVPQLGGDSARRRAKQDGANSVAPSGYFSSRDVVTASATAAATGPAATVERDASSTSSSSTALQTTTTAAELEADGESEADVEVEAEKRRRRMRWVAQMSEYWPIEYLGSLKAEQMTRVLETYEDKSTTARGAVGGSHRPSSASTTATTRRGATHLGQVAPSEPPAAASPDVATATTASSALADSDADVDVETAARGRAVARGGATLGVGASDGPVSALRRDSSQHSLALLPPSPPQADVGHVFLVGSGPGHPALLTRMAHSLITSPSTHLVLSDKLVPAPILRLIPATTPLVIAKKFPGNAEGAQSELIALALRAALEEGKRVVRLKQGDPFVYGRGGEELLAFRRAGVGCTLVPGISSSLAAPLMLGVPVTQRGAADGMVLCTGVGRGGKLVRLPGYERSRSTVILMGLARLAEVVELLTSGFDPLDARQSRREAPGRNGAAYPPYTPIAVVERASSTDQRLVASTLEGIASAIERVGEQRPPGMLMVGWAVLSLEGKGDVKVLDDEAECERVARDEVGVEDVAVVAGEADAGGARAHGVGDGRAATTGSRREGHDDDDDEARNVARENRAHVELRRRDLARVEAWLGERPYLVREGLDEAYTKALAEHSAVGPPSSSSSSSVQLEGAPLGPAAVVTSTAGQAPDGVGLGPRGGAVASSAVLLAESLRELEREQGRGGGERSHGAPPSSDASPSRPSPLPPTMTVASGSVTPRPGSALPTPATDPAMQQQQQQQRRLYSLESRSSTGWAPPRYLVATEPGAVGRGGAGNGPAATASTAMTTSDGTPGTTTTATQLAPPTIGLTTKSSHSTDEGVAAGGDGQPASSSPRHPASVAKPWGGWGKGESAYVAAAEPQDHEENVRYLERAAAAAAREAAARAEGQGGG